MTAIKIENLRTETPILFTLVDICKSELGAAEVWLFVSRARGDHAENSNWNVMAVLPDNASDDAKDPEGLLKLRRNINLPVDLVVSTRGEFYEAACEEGSFASSIKSEGIRLDA